MKFRPLHDRVVLKRIEAEEKSSGGIIIPDTAKEKPQQGEVVAVGPGGRDEAGKLIPIDLKAGDRVLFGKWSGTEVKIDGVEYLIMKESDVMGVLTETEPSPKGGLTPGKVGSSLLWSCVSCRFRWGRHVDHVRKPMKEQKNGCQTSTIFGRRARQDAARS